MTFSLIVAVASNGVIGKDGGLPWRLPADLAHFKAVTMGKPVIMGRRTWESIGRPLPGRRNIVVTSTPFEAVECAPSLDAALALVKSEEEVFVIGGARLFAEALPRADRLYWTDVEGEFEGDVRFPPVAWAEWKEVERRERAPDEKNPHRLTFVIFERILGQSVE